MSPTSIHPLADMTLRALTADKAGKPRLTPEACKAITLALRGYFGKPELQGAVIELLRIALMLKEKFDCEETAIRVLEIADTATKELNKLGSSADHEIAKVRRKLAKEFGTPPASATAPKVGEKAPAGSVLPGKLSIPRLLR